MYVVRTVPPSRLATVLWYGRIAWPWIKWLAWGTGKILLAAVLAYFVCIFALAGFIGGSWRGPR